MRASQRRQITRLAIAFGVGVFLGKLNTTAPGSSDLEHRPSGVAQEDTLARRSQQRPASFASRDLTAFSLLQPKGISLQPSLGEPYPDRTVAKAEPTGSTASGSVAANRQTKGDRLDIGGSAPAQAPSAAEIPSPVAVAAPQAGRPAGIARPPSVAPVVKDARHATPKIQLAYAAAPTADEPDGGIGRRRTADLAPPIVIGHTREDHEGGDVEEFAAKYEQIRKSGRKVEIDGLCVSACTIVASLPKDQVCVTPRAALGVHLASDPDDRVDLQYTDWAVKKYYPKSLQEWIKTHGGLQEEPKFVRGNDLLAIFKSCGSGA